MTETLLTIPPETPRWKELADLHGISTREVISQDLSQRCAEALIEWFGVLETETASTEKEAVVALIHRLKLTHWETVSL